MDLKHQGLCQSSCQSIALDFRAFWHVNRAKITSHVVVSNIFRITKSFSSSASLYLWNELVCYVQKILSSWSCLTELLQEGVGHSTANDDAICFVDQILDELNPKAWLIDVNVARKMPQLKHTLPMFSCDAFCLAQVLLTLISCRQIRSINK